MTTWNCSPSCRPSQLPLPRERSRQRQKSLHLCSCLVTQGAHFINFILTLRKAICCTTKDFSKASVLECFQHGPTPNPVCRLKPGHQYNRMAWPHTHTVKGRNTYFRWVNRLKDTQASLNESSTEDDSSKFLKWEAFSSAL